MNVIDFGGLLNLIFIVALLVMIGFSWWIWGPLLYLVYDWFA